MMYEKPNVTRSGLEVVINPISSDIEGQIECARTEIQEEIEKYISEARKRLEKSSLPLRLTLELQFSMSEDVAISQELKDRARQMTGEPSGEVFDRDTLTLAALREAEESGNAKLSVEDILKRTGGTPSTIGSSISYLRRYAGYDIGGSGVEGFWLIKKRKANDT